MAAIVAAQVIDGGRALALEGADGARVRFHAEWLRDNAPDPATRAPGSGQRLITLAEIPPDIRIAGAKLAADGRLSVTFDPGGDPIGFDTAWLLAHAYDGRRPRERAWLAGGIETWDAGLGAGAGGLPHASWRAVMGDDGALTRWLAAVRRYGFAILDDGPVAPGAVLDVVARFGHVRETNYGRTFQVRAEADPVNLAYTAAGLQVHTDNPYRDPVPGLQLLHCLENDAAGGETRLVDGFRAARRLAAADLELLSRHCACFEYAGAEGVHLKARRALIELAPDGELVAVRFNNRSAAALTDIPYDRMPHYYAACRRFAGLLEEPAMAVTFRLAPGQCLLFDNMRVLHGRGAYDGTGRRWLEGCYADRDGLLSTLSVLEAGTA